MPDFDESIAEIQAAIMEEIRGTYSETVIQHWLHPQHAGSLDDPDGFACVTGPCGDTMEIWLRVTGHEVVDATFWTDGCDTTIACGDAVVELAIGKTGIEAFAIGTAVLLRYLGGLPEPDQHCASLASNTLRKAILDCDELKEALGI